MFRYLCVNVLGAMDDFKLAQLKPLKKPLGCSGFFIQRRTLSIFNLTPAWRTTY
jgi:hypothetical protein